MAPPKALKKIQKESGETARVETEGLTSTIKSELLGILYLPFSVLRCPQMKLRVPTPDMVSLGPTTRRVRGQRGKGAGEKGWADAIRAAGFDWSCSGQQSFHCRGMLGQNSFARIRHPHMRGSSSPLLRQRA